MTYIRIEISETGASRPQDDHTLYNLEVIRVPDMGAAMQALTKRYGKKPGMRRKVYQDYREPTDAPGIYPRTRVCGFLHSFWNADLSHAPVKHWHQTDWVSFVEVSEKTPAE